MQRPERDRLKKSLDDVVSPLLLPVFLHLVERVRAFFGVSGVDIEKQDVAAAGTNLLDHFVHVRHGGAAVKVDAKDIQTRSGKLEAGCLAEPAR